MESAMIKQQRSGEQVSSRGQGLYEPSGELKERGGHPGHVSETSLYTKASLHPVMTTALLVGAGLTAAALWRKGKRNLGHLS
jgi:hypothetical protein